MSESEDNRIIDAVTSGDYKYGFSTNIEMEMIPKGLNEEVIREISRLKKEPEWMLDFRLKAYKKWLTMKEPNWAHLKIPPIDYQEIIYYAAPKERPKADSLEEVDPELLDTFKKLGISLEEQKRLTGVAVDAVFDSVSVKTTFSDTLSKYGIIFCSFSDAVKNHPDLVKKYLGTVVPAADNYFAALNSAVFSDGSFCYIPKG
ncbi:MAG: Fe-S cluster assembly protein SufB, partial [Bacteroidales bacterium]|nr:Fe-S cluster assembly protein SufB [Bacteroidales bacterium]